MRRQHTALACLALLLCSAIAIACGGSSNPTTNQPDCCGNGTSQSTASHLTTSRPSAGASGGLYIALGDSLSTGIGAADLNATGFVPLVHKSLGSRTELLNLGVPGATSRDLIDGGSLDRVVQEITKRKNDSDPNNDARLVTLEIGGNDLLQLYGQFVVTAICPDAATTIAKPECSDALRAALDGYRPNLTAALDRLRAADPSLRILLLTLYNPFQHVPGVGGLSDLSLEGQPNTPFTEGMNDIIRDVARGRDDVTVVDVYAPFTGKSRQYISADGIHPNDAGYQAMADAVIAALSAK